MLILAPTQISFKKQKINCKLVFMLTLQTLTNAEIIHSIVLRACEFPSKSDEQFPAKRESTLLSTLWTNIKLIWRWVSSLPLEQQYIRKFRESAVFIEGYVCARSSIQKAKARSEFSFNACVMKIWAHCTRASDGECFSSRAGAYAAL